MTNPALSTSKNKIIRRNLLICVIWIRTFVVGPAIFFFLFAVADLKAESTINSTNSYAWGANLGWINWKPSANDGVVIGEFICSGWIWTANAGWINVGNGFPINRIQYQNNSATDFGINYGVDPLQPGYAILRGTLMEPISAG